MYNKSTVLTWASHISVLSIINLLGSLLLSGNESGVKDPPCGAVITRGRVGRL